MSGDISSNFQVVEQLSAVQFSTPQDQVQGQVHSITIGASHKKHKFQGLSSGLSVKYFQLAVQHFQLVVFIQAFSSSYHTYQLLQVK
jgi:hypothetical protein